MLALTTATVEGQALAARISGKVLNSAGAPVARARVQTDATLGPQAQPFGGPRNFSGTTNDNGEWAILGITRGLWIFETSAAGHIPQAVAIPVNMMHAEANRPVTWRLPLRLPSLDELRAAGGAALADALAPLVGDAKMPQKEDLVRVVERARGMGLQGLSLCAAGGLALVARDLGSASAFFDRAEKSGVTDACAPLGMASIAMLALNADQAVAAYSRARSATPDKSLQQVMSAAIADLQKLGPTK
ncbi:MAG: carboxypeptidase-like regulatory domain-containing protein [Vicinamibacterales bacterium]